MPFYAWSCQPPFCLCSTQPPGGRNPCAQLGLSGSVIGGPFATQQQCAAFIAQSSACPHCRPTPLSRKVALTFVGYDEGDPNSGDIREVYEVDCCAGGTFDTVTYLPLRKAGMDEGTQGAGDMRDVYEADLFCPPFPLLNTYYKLRFVGYDRGDKCFLPVLPVYELVPNCVGPPCALCGPVVTYGGCTMPDTVCLHLRGTDAGLVVPLQFTTAPKLPKGFSDAQSFCQLSNFWDQGDCAWIGCFDSVIGSKVYVFMVEEAEQQKWNLCLFWKCGALCGGQWFFTITGCITNLVDPHDPSFGPAPICPGVIGGLFIDFHAQTTSPCTGMPGVYWDGFVSDEHCCPVKQSGVIPPQWYVCRPVGGGPAYCSQGGGCPACDLLLAGPFCSQCNCLQYIDSLP